ncbi:MAG: sulfite exporter TauE/SafE family protein [Hyphomicrobiales bacterium]|nr:sulfite exporter TauE/SafE family protein [Hyphomicrobiales bacterium]
MIDALALELGPAGFAFLALVILAASFVRGYSGFGFSAVLVAGLTLILPPAEVVPLSIGLEVVASLGQARGIWADIDRRRLMVLLIAGLIGNPLGVWLLVAIPVEPLRLALLSFIALASILLMVMPRAHTDLSLALLAGGGFAAGVVNGATALSGLVLALVFTLAGIRPAVMRATMIAYFFVTDLWTGGVMTAAGLVDQTTVLRVIAALPFLALGVWLGSRRFLATPPATFRVLVLWLLIGLSLIGLARSLI